MPEPDAVFHAETVAGVEQFVPTELARGPWDPGAQHGGAPSALLARAVERHEPGPGATQVARLTVELLRPVPLTPLVVQARTRRPGKQVQIVEASLFAGDTEVARATGLRLREKPLLVPPVERGVAPLPPGPGSGPIGEFDNGTDLTFGNVVDVVIAGGTVEEPGPALVWFRLRVPIVGGEVPSPLMRAAAAADFGNGISAVVNWASGWQFINPDLTVTLARGPVGEWVGLDAVTYPGPSGVGFAEAGLFDETGRIGRSVQCLLFDHPGVAPGA